MNQNRNTEDHLAAFTLAEILVSIAVLIGMLLIVLQMIRGVTSLAATGGKRIDTDAQARLVFDRIATDIGKMVRRPDIDYLFTKQANDNDAISFYCEYFGSNANTTDPTVSVVGYRINTIVGQGAQLERGDQNQNWASIVYAFSNSVFSQRLDTSGGATTLPAIANTSYQALADQVFRFEFTFALRDGSLSTSYYNSSITNQLLATRAPTPSDNGYQVGSWWSQPNIADYVCTGVTSGLASWKKTNKLTNIEALVVSIAALDNRSRVIMPKINTAPDLSALTNVLPDAINGEDIASSWNTIINGKNPGVPYPPVTVPPIPPAAANAVRVYQAYFRLGTPRWSR